MKVNTLTMSIHVKFLRDLTSSFVLENRAQLEEMLPAGKRKKKEGIKEKEIRHEGGTLRKLTYTKYENFVLNF